MRLGKVSDAGGRFACISLELHAHGTGSKAGGEGRSRNRSPPTPPQVLFKNFQSLQEGTGKSSLPHWIGPAGFRWRNGREWEEVCSGAPLTIEVKAPAFISQKSSTSVVVSGSLSFWHAKRLIA